MANITIKDLNPSESYLSDLTDEEIMDVLGGWNWGKILKVSIAVLGVVAAIL